MLAFAGSNDVVDYAFSNLPQGAGLLGPQYAQAAVLAQQLQAGLPDGALSITGHSLGGGLASVAALVTGAPAVTFNAAGVHAHTLLALGLDPEQAHQQAENGLIVTYSVEGDLLTGIQEDGPLAGIIPDAMGTQYNLNDPTPPQGPFGLNDPIADHNMPAVLEALAEQQPWA